MCHWVKLKCINKICPEGASVFCLIDGDEGQYKTYCDKILADISSGKYHALKRKTIENYIPLSVLKKSESFSAITESDIESITNNTGKLSKVLAQLKYEQDGKPWEELDKSSRLKHCNNIKDVLKNNVMQLITLDELEEYNGNEIKEILEKISSYLV